MSGITKPFVGQSYIDNGCRITRLTDAATIPDKAKGSGFVNTARPEYPTVCPWSARGTWMLVQLNSFWALFVGVNLVQLLPQIGASAQPRWSRMFDDLFYFIQGNRLLSYDVKLMTTDLVRQFSEYDTLTGKGESDIAEDGDILILAGMLQEGGVEAFVYDIPFDIKYTPVPLPEADFDSLYITAAGDRYTATLGDGIYLYDRDGNALGRVAPHSSHMDICRVDGPDELIRTNSGDADASSECKNGIEAIRLPTLENPDSIARRCLLPLGWNNPPENSLSVHISCTKNGKALVETCQRWGTTPEMPYANGLLLIDLRTAEMKWLAHHWSAVPPNSYDDIPLATIKADGSRVLFGSNWGVPVRDGGIMDAYLMEIPVHHPHHQPHGIAV